MTAAATAAAATTAAATVITRSKKGHGTDLSGETSKDQHIAESLKERCHRDSKLSIYLNDSDSQTQSMAIWRDPMTDRYGGERVFRDTDYDWSSWQRPRSGPQCVTWVHSIGWMVESTEWFSAKFSNMLRQRYLASEFLVSSTILEICALMNAIYSQKYTWNRLRMICIWISLTIAFECGLITAW